MIRLIPGATLGLAFLTLSGCDWLGIFAKEAAVAATSHRGWDTFTFKGQLPAEFGIDAIAFYGPKDRDKASCRAPTMEPGKTVTRKYGKRYTAEIQAQPQEFSFEIPLSYYQGLCGMRLGRVKLEIKIRHGKEKWQKTYADGNFYIDRSPSANSSPFDKSGKLDIKALCSLMFQESKIHHGIDKLMSCKAAGVNFSDGELKNKTVDLTIEVDPEEKPSHDDTWIKFPNGWKPCLPREGGWIRCQSPPVFKTFKMNGQTCTVYPNCKEQ